ncbi:aldo/keto reductase family protein [Cytobacillus sp. FJAT-54145]|uniref:Aldo/keto reductase family protein n=1 Tax=Cytobacillus spartinae TaxID=3299023 RepID=A0ABW6K7M9_9BACI
MNYRGLGRSGLKVSELGLGTYLTFGEKLTEKESISIIQKAFENGINFFDTANVYQGGLAEEILGRALKSIPRLSTVIGTKAYFRVGDGPNDKGLSRKHIIEQAHKSLKRLDTDYIDVFYCHSFDKNTPIEETLRAIDDLIRQGTVLYAGVSNWSAEQINEAIRIADQKLLDRIIVSQCEYSLLKRGIEKEMIPASEKLGVSQVVFSPLAQGILTGKYNNGTSENSRANQQGVNKFFHQLYTKENMDVVKNLDEIANQYDFSLSELAILWVLRKKNVASAIMGISSVRQLELNLKAVRKTLNKTVIEEVEKVLAQRISLR